MNNVLPFSMQFLCTLVILDNSTPNRTFILLEVCDVISPCSCICCDSAAERLVFFQAFKAFHSYKTVPCNSIAFKSDVNGVIILTVTL